MWPNNARYLTDPLDLHYIMESRYFERERRVARIIYQLYTQRKKE